MIEYRLVAEPELDLDIAAAFDWYEEEHAGLGYEFLGELRATYNRIADGPLKYQHVRSGIRRALVRRFPYGVYFFHNATQAVNPPPTFLLFVSNPRGALSGQPTPCRLRIRRHPHPPRLERQVGIGVRSPPPHAM